MWEGVSIKYVFIYFSGTGNTKLVTNQLSEELERNNNEVSVYSVEQVISEGKIDLAGAVLGIGFPVYKFTYPKIMKRIFPILEKGAAGTQGSPFFVYSTYCRFCSSSLKRMADDVEKLGFGLIAAESFKCPSNGIASLKDTESYEYQTVMYFENRIDLKIKRFADKVVDKMWGFYETGETAKLPDVFTNGLAIKIVGKIEKARYPKLAIDQSTCTLCGVCVKRCPEENLRLSETKVEIIDDKNCLHCLRCLHGCPSHSVTFGELVFGPNRYDKKTMMRLYRQAADTSEDTPEKGTKKIKRKWALKNMQYWIFHR